MAKLTAKKRVRTTMQRYETASSCILIVCILAAICECSADIGDGDARQSRSQRQLYFLDVLSGKDVQPASNDVVTSDKDENDAPINPAKIAELNRLVGVYDIYQSIKPEHTEALQKCIVLMRERDNWRDIMTRATKLREKINIQLWINAFLGTTILSPAMFGLNKPALIELSPDRYLSRRVIERAINQSGSGKRQGLSCTTLDETTGRDNGVENAPWYFREDIQVNAQHWYWHLTYPQRFPAGTPLPPSNRRGELFYFFHENMLARYNSERLSNNLDPTVPLKADTRNEVVEEGYVTYLTDINSGRNWGSRPANQPISYGANQPYLTNVYEGIDARTFRARNGQDVNLRNVQGIDILGDVVESSVYSINPGLYGNIHNMGHVLLAILTQSIGVMADTATAMRDIVFYRWHTFVNDIFERHKSLLPEYSVTGMMSLSDFTGQGDIPLVWTGVQVTSLQINSGFETPPNNLKTFWSQRTFDISRGLDLRRDSSTNGPVPVCIKHLNHDSFTYTINIAKLTPNAQRATIRIFLAPRFNRVGTRFTMEEQRKLMFILDTFSANLNPGNNVMSRNSSDSTLTKPWSKTFQELEREVDSPRPSMPQCGCGWPEHLLIPKGTENGMIFDLFVLVTNGADDSAGNLGDQTGSCSQPYHFCGVRGQNYPDRKPMGYPFDRRSPFLSPGRRVANLDEFVALIPNSQTVQVKITHVNQVI